MKLQEKDSDLLTIKKPKNYFNCCFSMQTPNENNKTSFFVQMYNKIIVSSFRIIDRNSFGSQVWQRGVSTEYFPHHSAPLCCAPTLKYAEINAQ